jgi:hypothetical protein
MIWSDNGHIHLSDIFFNLLKAVRTWQTHSFLNVYTLISSNLNGYKDGRRNYLSVINDQMTTKIFLPSDLRMMGGQESERDQVWATEDGILHILIQ